MIEFGFTPDGWIEFKKDDKKTVAKRIVKSDKFSDKALSLDWQWSVFKDFKKNLSDKSIQISALPDVSGAYIGQPVLYADYTAETEIIASNAEAGIAIIGDDKHIIFASVKDGKVLLKQVRNGETKVLQTIALPASSNGAKLPIKLKLQAQRNHDFTFYYSVGGKPYTAINATPVDGSFLPPWDRALRVGVTVIGTRDQSATFSKFTVK